MSGPRTSVAARPPKAVEAPRRRNVPYPWLKPGIFLGAMIPLAYLVMRGYNGTLSANPIAEGENELGLAALIFLLASLACSPAKRLLGWTWPMRIRRELGLLAFFYASLHFFTYVFLDKALFWDEIVADIVKRPFITVGFLAFVILVPLALTSTNNSVKRLGYMRWLRIHQLIYVAGILAVIHFLWRVKIDVGQPVNYALILTALLAIRVGWWIRKKYFPSGRAG